MGYDVDSMPKREIVAEIAAHIVSGEGELVNLAPDEEASWLKNYHDRIERLDGTDGALKLLTEAVDRFSPLREEYAKRIETTKSAAESQPGAQPEANRDGLLRSQTGRPDQSAE